MRFFVWLARAFIFFSLFAFALNNQQPVQLHWFFGFEWQTRMVFVVLAAFSAGCALGVLAMLPGWWRKRRETPARPVEPPRESQQPPVTAPVPPSDFVSESRLREGL